MITYKFITIKFKTILSLFIYFIISWKNPWNFVVLWGMDMRWIWFQKKGYRIRQILFSILECELRKVLSIPTTPHHRCWMIQVFHWIDLDLFACIYNYKMMNTWLISRSAHPSFPPRSMQSPPLEYFRNHITHLASERNNRPDTCHYPSAPSFYKSYPDTRYKYLLNSPLLKFY